MEITKELLEKLRAAKSEDEFANILAEQGIELSPEERKEWYQRESKRGELSEAELAEVAGGNAVVPKRTYGGIIGDPDIKMGERGPVQKSTGNRPLWY